MNSIRAVALALMTLALVGAGPASGPTREPSGRPMNDSQLDQLIKRVDPKAQMQGNVRQLNVEGHAVLVVSDAKADRMRIMSPIRGTEGIEPAELTRLLQANFDAVLDARYAIGQNTLWSAFIHPLSPLTPEQFFSAMAQVVVAAATYGKTYTSGALVFGGGDTNRLHRELYERIRKKGKIKI